VHYARQLYIRELVNLGFQRTRRQPKVARNLNETGEIDAATGAGITLPQTDEIDLVTVVTGDHRETGQTAFRLLGL
jgi:hypothetical protein